jgi:putative Ca2+/H+ antiporter (TMEM165/GDT1 family)
MAAVLIAFAVVFLAELGDKTQLVVLSHGPRHDRGRLMAALAAAIVVLQAISVTAGGAVGGALPERTTAVVVGVLFLAFGAWTWRGATHADADRTSGAGGPWTVAGAFFLAELGDKTMITTASLAADRGVVATYVGSVAAMLAAASIALVAGTWVHRRVAPRTLARAGAVAFVVVGVATLAAAA